MKKVICLWLSVLLISSQTFACLVFKPNYSVRLKGSVTFEENGKTHDDCHINRGYFTLENGELFRIQQLTIDCKNRLHIQNSMFFWLKDGSVNEQYAGFSGVYDEKNFTVKYSYEDNEGTYDEQNSIKWSNKCDSVDLLIAIQQTGKIQYDGKIKAKLSISQ